jgi:phosphoglycerate kinase
MKLRTLPSTAKLKGKRVLVRVDWNVPLHGLAPEESLKIERSIPHLKALASRGAIVVVLTHLGRPKGRENTFSTQRLPPLLAGRYALHVSYHSARLSDKTERAELLAVLKEAKAGTIHLLENVRFESGEERNDARLAKAYAEIGQVFVNDAFASSHRKHVSVSGLAKVLPSYAGPSLIQEVSVLSMLLQKPKRPFLSFIGGLKLSTKMPVLEALLKICDRVAIGGAMATTFAAAQKQKTGKSFVEKASIPLAKKFLANNKLLLPVDVMVTQKISIGAKEKRVDADAIGKDDIVVDAGMKTLAAWGREIRQAQTILWNGPVGITEVFAFGSGSRFLARAIGARAKGSAFGVAGGGDTLPVLVDTKTLANFDHVSMGGGAMLEFLVLKGKLPGLIPLLNKK